MSIVAGREVTMLEMGNRVLCFYRTTAGATSDAGNGGATVIVQPRSSGSGGEGGVGGVTVGNKGNRCDPRAGSDGGAVGGSRGSNGGAVGDNVANGRRRGLVRWPGSSGYGPSRSSRMEQQGGKTVGRGATATVVTDWKAAATMGLAESRGSKGPFRPNGLRMGEDVVVVVTMQRGGEVTG
ncbi:uncharacterized protein LOC135611538 [Musa acuminata AAA Group]|uniref:uncharacterized protein LOC135611538 n=1 Tax=Musa acuminata AAA Group TaxID=214697 RepID=UPI0031D6DBC2